MSTSPLHKYATSAHPIESSSMTYANAAARTSDAAPITADIGRIAYQTDTGEYWRLIAVGPVAWQRIDPTSLRYTGVWSSVTAYLVNDVVSSGGVTYVALLAGANQAVTNLMYWAPLGARSSDGLLAANNLSDVLSASTARTNLGLGSAATLTAGAAGGAATLDSSGTLTSSQIPASLVGDLSYQGVWNAATNSPTLASGAGTKGCYYKVGTAGITELDGHANWRVGDLVIFDGSAWDQIEAFDPPVFGASGFGHSAGLAPDPGPTAGAARYLCENGTWNTPSGGTGSSALAGDTDVLLSAPADGDMLTYVASAGKWENRPPGAAYAVTSIIDGGASARVNAPLSITSFTPNTQNVADTVALTGIGFAHVSSVAVGGVSCGFAVTNDTALVLTVANGAVTGPISLCSSRGDFNSLGNLTVTGYATPTISRLSADSGVDGAEITITGANLGGVSSVEFNGTAASFMVVSSTEITTNVPSGATSGPITVTNLAGTATSSSFTVIGVVVAGFTPLADAWTGVWETSNVMVHGSGFTGATGVSLGGWTPDTFTVNSDAQITATLSRGIIADYNGPVTVTVGSASGSSDANISLVIPPPV